MPQTVEQRREWRKNNPHYSRDWARAHATSSVASRRKWSLENPATALWWYAKRRSRKYGLPFDITPEDIEVPAVCPVLGIPLFKGDGVKCDNSPSLDQLKPRAGYTKDNIRVISYRANMLKNNGTAEEFDAIAAYIRSHQ